jgi:hypothetical protein
VVRPIYLACLVSGFIAAGAPTAAAQEQVDRTRDRGTGIPLSIFGTYVEPGELIVYPFYEYYRDSDYEYEAADLGYVGTTEHRGRYRAHEYLLFLAYGFTPRLTVEFEIAGISAMLDKAPGDSSMLPERLEQAGLGDVEGQLRWRWNRETETRPEYFSYAEIVVPAQQSKLLIGTTEWEYKFGTGIIRGLSWGTVTARAAVATSSGGGFELGEYAVEYLRRLSRRVKVFAALEGSEDEVELITELQVFLGRRVRLKLNNAFGVTSKAPDWAPEIGVLFSMPIG